MILRDSNVCVKSALACLIPAAEGCVAMASPSKVKVPRIRGQVHEAISGLYRNKSRILCDSLIESHVAQLRVSLTDCAKRISRLAGLVIALAVVFELTAEGAISDASGAGFKLDTKHFYLVQLSIPVLVAYLLGVLLNLRFWQYCLGATLGEFMANLWPELGREGLQWMTVPYGLSEPLDAKPLAPDSKRQLQWLSDLQYWSAFLFQAGSLAWLGYAYWMLFFRAKKPPDEWFALVGVSLGLTMCLLVRVALLGNLWWRNRNLFVDKQKTDNRRPFLLERGRLE